MFPETRRELKALLKATPDPDKRQWIRLILRGDRPAKRRRRRQRKAIAT